MSATPYELGLIITLFAGAVTLIFAALAGTFLVGNISMLTVFITLIFFEIIIAYIIRIATSKGEKEEEESKAGDGRFDPPV